MSAMKQTGFPVEDQLERICTRLEALKLAGVELDNDMQCVLHDATEALNIIRSAPSQTVPIGDYALGAELQALKRDAERYRWLRDRSFHESDDFGIFYKTNVNWSGLGMVPGEARNRTEGEMLDAAIDRARTQGGG